MYASFPMKYTIAATILVLINFGVNVHAAALWKTATAVQSSTYGTQTAKLAIDTIYNDEASVSKTLEEENASMEVTLLEDYNNIVNIKIWGSKTDWNAANGIAPATVIVEDKDGNVVYTGAITADILNPLSHDFPAMNVIAKKVTITKDGFGSLALAGVRVYGTVATAAPTGSPTLAPTAAPAAPISSGGDPHFTGFGGHFFSWHGHCDIILHEFSTKIGSKKNVLITARTTKVKAWSSIERVAIGIDDNVAEVGFDGKLQVNGKEVEKFESESLDVSKQIRGPRNVEYLFNFGEGISLIVKAYSRNRMVFTDLRGASHTTGVLGSLHKTGFFARNGTSLTYDDTVEFVESWQVLDTDAHLFNTDRPPQYPEKCVYKTEEVKSYVRGRRLNDVMTVTRDRAIVACAMHSPGEKRDSCVEDVIATGDIDLALDTFYE